MTGEASAAGPWSPARRAAIFWAITLVGVVRIVLTFEAFGHTFDEAAHIGAGMAWLTGQGYYEYQHPPLARVVAALPLYVMGFEWPQPPETLLRPGRQSAVDSQGHAVLRWRGEHERNLALARAGMLVFFLIGAGVVWAWTRYLYGELSAAVAIGLLVCTPPVLGHAGLAATDMALAAMLTAALYAFVRWLEAPSVRWSLALGLAVGLAIASKISSVLFLAAAAPAILLSAWILERVSPASIGREALRRLPVLAISLAVAFVTVWAVYGFSIDAPSYERPAAGVSTRTLKAAAHELLKIPIPAGGLVRGVVEVRKHQGRGHLAYFFGDFRERGWWYYYPVELAIKTPIPFLLLALAGAVFSFRRSLPTRLWQSLAPVVCALAILVAATSSRINIGVRHVLPVYLLLCVVAGRAVYEAARSSHRSVSLAVVALLAGWLAVYSLREHPDYLASFSELVRAPERIVSDSDLDWGQDFRRLSARARELGIEKLAIGGCSTCGYSECEGLPETCRLEPRVPVTGWVAVSEWCLRVWPRSRAAPVAGAFDWLEGQSYERVGRSIRLYHFPEPRQ